MAQALYRKYRPKKLSEVVGQEHITKTLENALKSGKISHAYLFTGPHGVGKTSVARILAHEVNGLKYDDDSNHLDIIEIDAASNRRIDEIRDLRDKVHISPTSAKYKVYIIDEVHMLTREAFNALLKTLEEPPEHVIFILATTEVHKLPETIISRTQRHSFKPIELGSAVKQLRQIAKDEKFSVDDDALELIAEHGEGSFRDSISLLDQSRHSGKLTIDDVRRVLGIAPETVINELFNQVINGSAGQLLEQLNLLKSEGYQSSIVAKQLSNVVRNELLSKNPRLDPSAALKLLSGLLKVPTSQSPEQLLELALLDIIYNKPARALDSRPDDVVSPSATMMGQTKTPEQTVATKHEKISQVLVETTTEVALGKKDEAVQTEYSGLSEETWADILSELKKQHSTLYGVIRMSSPTLNDRTLYLSFKFGFHQKQMKEPKNHNKFRDIVAPKLGDDVLINYVLAEKTEEKQAIVANHMVSPKETEQSINNISNIFGGAEVLES